VGGYRGYQQGRLRKSDSAAVTAVAGSSIGGIFMTSDVILSISVVLVVLVILGIIGLLIYLAGKQKRLLSEVKTIERAVDFLEQDHRFFARINNLEYIGNTLNQTALAEDGIFFVPYYAQGIIVFYRCGTVGIVKA
jgi:hypothetical protein